MIQGSSKLNPAQVAEAVRENNSYLHAARALGVNRKTIKAYLDAHPHDITHWVAGSGRPLTDEQVFSRCLVRRNHVVKSRALAAGHLSEECQCGQGPIWNGKPLTLEMNHIDGDPCNNNLDNLEILCPNCHSQTPTSKGRNSRGIKKTR